MAFSSLIGALIGAAAALLGVIVTQRNTRRQAHKDRVWEKQTAAYEALFLLCERDLGILGRARVAWSAEDRQAIDTPLPAQLQVQLWLYGGESVARAYGEYVEDRLRIVLSDPVHGLVPNDSADARAAYRSNIDVVRAQCVNVRNTLMRELRVG